MTEQRILLVVLQRSPYGHSAALETLDAALSATAFDYDVRLLFLGEAIWQLLRHQDANAVQHKTFTKVLAGLHWYDIKQCYTTIATLQDSGLTASDSAIPITVLSSSAVHTLMNDAALILHG